MKSWDLTRLCTVQVLRWLDQVDELQVCGGDKDGREAQNFDSPKQNFVNMLTDENSDIFKKKSAGGDMTRKKWWRSSEACLHKGQNSLMSFFFFYIFI